jgi:lipoprotein-anchoring transpeptidase ErfK/SrfK
LILILALTGFISGCDLIGPSARLIVTKNSNEVDPVDGARLVTSGIGARIEKLEATAQKQPATVGVDEDGYLQINKKKTLDTNTLYEVKVWLAGIQDRHAYRRFTFQTYRTPIPEISPVERRVRYDEGIVIKWNMPVRGITYELPPGVQSRVSYNGDCTTCMIRLVNYEQEQYIDLKIKDATSVSGKRMRPVPGGYVQKIATTSPLGIEISPPEGSIRVPRGTEITVTFNEDIANPENAVKALSVEPEMDGDIAWLSANQFKFVPKGKWDYDQEVKVSLKRGTSSLVGASGNYINRTYTTSFETAPLKLIDIDLSNQTIVCYEEGVEVFSCLCATGKSGYSTPAGNYRIYDKERYTDMRNTPDMGETYLVTDVPYVNWFYGGHAIHGCYWSDSYGYPRSHGCVNVSVSNAGWIYDWAPVNTPVIVHY